MLANIRRVLYVVVVVASIASANPLFPRQSTAPDLSTCPGYEATNVKTTSTGLTADLSLAGVACNVYGTDLTSLTLTVEHQTGS